MELSDLTLGFVGYGAMAQKDAPIFAPHVKRVLVADTNDGKLKKVEDLRRQGITNVHAATSADVARQSDITVVAITPIRNVPEAMMRIAEQPSGATGCRKA